MCGFVNLGRLELTPSHTDVLWGGGQGWSICGGVSSFLPGNKFPGQKIPNPCRVVLQESGGFETLRSQGALAPGVLDWDAGLFWGEEGRVYLLRLGFGYLKRLESNQYSHGSISDHAPTFVYRRRND